MKIPLHKEALAQLFTEARTYHSWKNQEVSDEQLQKIYDLMKWGPTALNALPIRILFIKGEEAKEKLYPALSPGNIEQTKEAPVVAILAYDEKFYEQLPDLFPAYDARAMFKENPSLTQETALRNSSLQGAYFMMAARALGLDVGPMSGFDSSKVNEAFFKDTSWKVNFICALGYGDERKLYPRGPRLNFEQVCRIE